MSFEAFRERAEVSKIDLWWAYFALGGNATPLQVGAFLDGTVLPDRHDHDLLAQALNDAFSDLDRDAPVPYFDDLI